MKLIFRIMLCSPAQKSRNYIQLMQKLRVNGYGKMASIISRILQKRGLFVSPYAEISKTVSFPHPTGIVIGDGVVIGDNVKVFQNVTLGGKRIGDWEDMNYPKICEGVVLFAGAVVVGDIRIGNNVVIGANSVVVSDVPDGAVAVGAPARIIKRNNVVVSKR